MQAGDIDNNSEYPSDTREGGARGLGLGNAAVHELNPIKAEAIRDIGEGGFRLKLCFIVGTGLFRDA